jgi:hypothetical protein
MCELINNVSCSCCFVRTLTSSNQTVECRIYNIFDIKSWLEEEVICFPNRDSNVSNCCTNCCRSQWPRGLRHGSAAARLLGLWVRIPAEAWMSVSCECRVLSGRVLCLGLITRQENSYRVWRVCV